MSDNDEVIEVDGLPLNDSDLALLGTAQDMIEKGIDSQECGAKQVISTAGLLLGIYFVAISLSDLKKGLVAQQLEPCEQAVLVVVFVAPIIFWLISMVLALRVFVPVSHYDDIYSHEKALGTYTRILNLKYKRLKYAIMMLVLGFILPVICIIVYLVRSP